MEEEKKKVSLILNLSKPELYIFLGVGLALILLPLLFTWDSISWISFKDKGEIGDAIGGITAPFIGFGGSILVYLALKAQIDANNKIQEQFAKQEQDNQIEKRIDYFKNRTSIIQFEINNFYYVFIDINTMGNPKFYYQGAQAIHKLLQNSTNSYYGQKERTPYELEPKLVELKSLLVFFEFTVIEIINDILIDEENKSNILNVLQYILNSKIKANFESVKQFKSEHNSACPEGCGNYHGIPSELFDIVDNIAIKITI